MVRHKMLSTVHIWTNILFLCFISVQVALAASPENVQEKLLRIQRECAKAYPKDLLIKFMENSGYLKGEKGDFSPTEFKDLPRPFSFLLKPGMKFIDLGSGDGRVVFLASVYGVEATGIEYDDRLYQVSLDAMANLSDVIDSRKIKFIKGDFLKHDFSTYDVFYLYLADDGMHALRDKLYEEMKPGSIALLYDTDDRFVEKLDFIRRFLNEDINVYRKSP